MNAPGRIKVGCSGFSYRDWRGTFYPPHIPQDQLISYYERFFEILELNFSFYKMPDVKQIASLVERTAKIKFSVKATSVFTHERSYSQEELKAFRTSLNPLLESGRFICVLFQFPQSFHWSHEAREYLARLSEDFGGIERVMEPRSRTFLRDEVLIELEMMGFSVANVDVPKIKGLFHGPWKRSGSINYVRLHGRNGEKWYEGETSFSRYDYLYSEEEIEEIRERLERAFGKEEVYVFFNNHYRAKAVLNAFMLISALGEEVGIPSSLKGSHAPSLWE